MGIQRLLRTRSRSDRADDRKLPDGVFLASDARLSVYRGRIAAGRIYGRLVVTNNLAAIYEIKVKL